MCGFNRSRPVFELVVFELVLDCFRGHLSMLANFEVDAPDSSPAARPDTVE
jgi:hypothetical protein